MKRFLVVAFLVAAGLSLAYGALIYYDNNFMYGRMRETPVVKPHENAIPTMEEGVVPVQGGEAMFRLGDGEARSLSMAPDSADTLARGKMAYSVFCIPCHGQYFDGMGTVGQSFHPLPTDLKSPQVQGQDRGALFHTISYGKQRMPALATTISVQDRRAVIHFFAR